MTRLSISNKLRTLITILILAVLLIVYFESGLHEEISIGNLRKLGSNAYAPFLIIATMTIVWTFPLPASIFFFITPLLYPPIISTLIITVGSFFGSIAGYAAAKNIAGDNIDKYLNNKVAEFLRKHSSFAHIFALRIIPSSPHFVINYSAGFLKIPIIPFITATVTAISIKAFFYSLAVDSTISAESLSDAIDLKTVLPLFALALIAVAAKILKQKWEEKEKPNN